MQVKQYDVIVIGGGMSGVAAAIAAGRQGMKTMVIEQSNCFGGSAVNCLVNPFMPFTKNINGKNCKMSKGLFEEILVRMKEFSENAVNDSRVPEFNEEYMKIILNEMINEANVEVLFHSIVGEVETEDNEVKSITAVSKFGRVKLSADYYIDATGDADVAAMAGFPFLLGREGDHFCQPMTLCFRLGNIDMDLYEKEKCDITPLYKEKQKNGEIKNPRENVLIFYTTENGVLHFNSTRIVKLNPTDVFDMTKAELEAREQVKELFMFLKSNFKSFENSFILSTAAYIGVRESRKIIGEYILKGEDVKQCREFNDSIALCCYDMDIHNPEGTGTEYYFLKKNEHYTIPYKALIPKNSKNLLVVGRSISSDQQAQSSFRIMPTVCCIGEAGGLAISLAKKENCNVLDIDMNELHKMMDDNNCVYKKY